jgi:hypothetical protein
MQLLLDVAETSVVSTQNSDGAWIGLLVYVVVVAGLWAMLEKAGLPGWGALIPVYNLYLQIKLANYSGVLLFLYLVPGVNLIVAIFVAFGIARSFDRGPMYGVLFLFVLQPVGFLITGFGSAQYVGERPWDPL